MHSDWLKLVTWLSKLNDVALFPVQNFTRIFERVSREDIAAKADPDPDVPNDAKVVQNLVHL